MGGRQEMEESGRDKSRKGEKENRKPGMGGEGRREEGKE